MSRRKPIDAKILERSSFVLYSTGVAITWDGATIRKHGSNIAFLSSSFNKCAAVLNTTTNLWINGVLLRHRGSSSKINILLHLF